VAALTAVLVKTNRQVIGLSKAKRFLDPADHLDAF
jgi:hypothetical protein